jgi:pilus assembly protein CpaF
MVQAMSTGHDGSLSTCHAASPAEALRRLEAMMLQADVGLPLDAIREQLHGAVDLVVQVARGPGGRRHVVEIAELAVDPRDASSPGRTTRLATADRVLARPRRSTRRPDAPAPPARSARA